MALNRVYAGTPERIRERALSTITSPTVAPTTIQTGVPVRFADGPAVSVTASNGASVVRTTNLPKGLTSVTYTNGGVGNAVGNATFAFDGVYEFAAVTGVTNATANNVEVFITSTGALTLTASGNTHYGWTDYPRDYYKQALIAPVRIGA